MNFGGIIEKIGNLAAANNFGEINFHGITGKLGRVSRCGSFYGLWTSRLQAVVLQARCCLGTLQGNSGCKAALP